MRKGRFPPFGFVSSEFWLCALVLHCFWRFLIPLTELWIFEAFARKMCKGRFPPFGFVSSELWLCALVLQWFWAVWTELYPLKICQKDAQGSVSPLRVRIKRVSARRARFATVFGGSLIRLTDSGFEGVGPGRAGRDPQSQRQ